MKVQSKEVPLMKELIGVLLERNIRFEYNPRKYTLTIEFKGVTDVSEEAVRSFIKDNL